MGAFSPLAFALFRLSSNFIYISPSHPLSSSPLTIRAERRTRSSMRSTARQRLFAARAQIWSSRFCAQCEICMLYNKNPFFCLADIISCLLIILSLFQIDVLSFCTAGAPGGGRHPRQAARDPGPYRPQHLQYVECLRRRVLACPCLYFPQAIAYSRIFVTPLTLVTLLSISLSYPFCAD